MIQQADKLLCESWNEPNRSVAHDRPDRQRRISLAGDPLRALQNPERR
jgi:hypothetical protein